MNPIVRVFAPGGPFQPCLTFMGEPGAYSRVGAPERFVPARNKHGHNYYTSFTSKHMNGHKKLECCITLGYRGSTGTNALA